MIARTVLLSYFCIYISNHIVVYIFYVLCALCYLYNSVWCTCNHFHRPAVMRGLLCCCLSFMSFFMYFFFFLSFFLFCLSLCSSLCLSLSFFSLCPSLCLSSCIPFFNYFLTMSLFVQSASLHSTIITVKHLACIEMRMWEGVVQCVLCFIFFKQQHRGGMLLTHID